jgi:hypothetical protein
LTHQRVTKEFPTVRTGIAPSTQVRAASLRERKDDLYETPACVTHALLEVERLPRRIWEPAAGRGAIVKVLRAVGHEVVATDLISYGQPDQAARRDFLLEQHAPDGCEAIVTNPPFKLAGEFAAHALDLVPRVFMFLRLAFLERAGPKTGSAIAFAWFCWDRGHRGPALLDRIEARMGEL